MDALRGVWVGLALGALALIGSPAAQAEPSGTVLAVVQSAEVDSQTGEKILEVEAPVYAGDRIITGKSPKDAYSITTPTATIGVRG